MNYIMVTELRLTPRQKEVLTLFSRDGKTTKEIAAELQIKYCTVRAHLSNAQERLGAETLAQTVFLATANGLIAAENETGEPVEDVHG